jgi:tetratricopeptide (TPR) repeat protein
LNSEYSVVDGFLSEKIIKDKKAEKESHAVPPEVIRNRYRAPRYAFASIIIIGLVYLSLYIISSFSTPAYYNDAALNDESEFSVNRGRATEDFQNSLKALEKHNYDSAIKYLQKDIQQNPDDETIFYSYYIMGLSYLETAGHDFLGLFPVYNKERVVKGAEYLKESVQKNNSGKFTNIKLNSYFYLAKSSLMLSDKQAAREYLLIVINERGGKMDEARQLLGELE